MPRKYSNRITLSKNARGIYSLDTVMGCTSGTAEDDKGCYGDCYAARYARRYGWDFGSYVLRGFDGEKHVESIKRKINNIDMPFVRIGTSGDPSENWHHTMGILQKIKDCNKDFALITKHWKNIPDSLLDDLSGYGLCINTSVSALDKKETLENALEQHERIKPYCKAVLRVVTCDFNTLTYAGYEYAKIQDDIISRYPDYIDTVFRVSKSNRLVVGNVINVKETKFLGKKCLVSKLNKKTFFGRCGKCPEMCGTVIPENVNHITVINNINK